MAKKKSLEVEWVGGIKTLGGYAAQDGKPYHPDMLLWINDESTLGIRQGPAEEILAEAGDHLTETIEMARGRGFRLPSRVRVASPELAAILRDSHPQLQIVCEPTPEIEEIIAGMETELEAEREGEEQTYLGPGREAGAVASFFRAAARFFRVQPWDALPVDQNVFSVSIEALGVRDQVLTVVGETGSFCNTLLFSNLDDYEGYLDAVFSLQRGEKKKVPQHRVLEFQPMTQVSPSLRKEIAKHHWEVADLTAYPSVLALNETMISRPATPEELVIFEALCLALPDALASQRQMRAAWKRGPAFQRTFSVKTHRGEVQVSLCTPPVRTEPPQETKSKRPALRLVSDPATPAKARSSRSTKKKPSKPEGE